MNTVFSYSLLSSIAVAFLYIGYKWSLSGERRPTANRMVLLGIIFCGLFLFPLIDIISGAAAAIMSPTASPSAEPGEIMAAGIADEPPAISLTSVVYSIWLAGALATAASWALGFFRIHRLIKNGEIRDAGEFRIVVTGESDHSPFSWGRYIFMCERDTALPDSEFTMLITHEARHLSSRHWLDLMPAQLLCVLQWFNPAAWLLRDELRDVHEYEADMAVLNSGADHYSYQMLIIKRAVGKRFPSVANSFNHSKLKNRITMMLKSESTARRRWRGLALVPALAAALLVAGIPAVASVADNASEASFIPMLSSAGSKISENNHSVQAAAPESDKVFVAVDKLPEYPGGMSEMMKYLAQNIVYPESSMKNNEEGTVVVKFVVKADGKIGDAEVIRAISPALDEEAIRVVKSMPAWKPGENGGKKVACYFTLPVKFKLQGDVPAASGGTAK